MFQVKLAQIDINNPVSLGIKVSTLACFIHIIVCVCIHVCLWLDSYIAVCMCVWLEVNYFLSTCHRT